MEPAGKRSLEGRDGAQSSLEAAIKRCKIENCPISDLPKELLAAVLERLPTGDKGRAAQVCHMWHELVDSPMLWKKTQVVIDLDTTPADCLLNLKKRQVPHLTITACSSVKKLRKFLDSMLWLEYLDLKKLKGLPHETHCRLFPHEMPAMKTLFLPCLGTQTIRTIATKMQNLEVFRSFKCQCNPPEMSQKIFETLSTSPTQCLWKFLIPEVLLKDRDVVHLKTGLPNVKELWLNLSPEMSEVGIQTLAEMASVEKLCLEGASLEKISIRPLCTEMANIRNLQLFIVVSEANARHLATMNHLEELLLIMGNDAILERLSEGLPKLRTLNLFHFTEMTASGLTTLARMVQLECLNLAYCPVDDDGLQILSIGLVNLNTLELSHCQNFTDEGLTYVGGMPALHTLGLFNCKAGDAGLRSLSEGTAPLACLKVGRCSRVTQQGRQACMDKHISIEEHHGSAIIL